MKKFYPIVRRKFQWELLLMTLILFVPSISKATSYGTNLVTNGNTETGAFTAQPTGLTPGTSYHARAFTTNTANTSYGTDVTFTTTATMTEPGNALSFDGMNDYVNLGDKIEGLATLTIETWVYYASGGSSDYDEIFSKENVNSLNIWRSGGDKVWFHLGTGTTWFDGGRIVSNSSVPKDRWTHIAVTWDQATTTVKIYINGVLDIAAQHRHSKGSVMGSNSTLRGIGGYPVTPSHPFKGKLDELRVWNVVRSQAEIQSDMVTAISSAAGLLCSFNFNEGTAGGNNTAGTTILTDLTGNGNNGTLTNFVLTGTTSNWVESYAMVVPTATAASSLTVSGFTANWTAPVTGTVTNYKLYVATDAAFTRLVAGYDPLTVASTSTSSAITGLSANATYYYRIRADKTSVTGEGACSNSISAQTLPQASIITTQPVSDIGIISATGNGNITDLGNPNPTAYGVCWNTTGTPTISDSKTDNGAATVTGAFIAPMTSLTANTTYYVRAFATNTAGTSYGTQVSFTTLTNGTFTAASNNDWATATNWAGGGVPTSATDVTIPSGKNPVIGSTTTAYCNNLTVIGSLTIQSSSSGTGSLIVSGTSTGTITAERYMTGSKWHMVSPIATGGSISNFIQAPGNAIPLSGSNYGMMDYNEPTNTWNSYFTSSTSENLTAGKGYGIRRSSDGVVIFTGTLISGTNTVAITKGGTEGWNLIGNPYTSSIYMNTAANSSYNFLKTNAIDASKLDPSYACIYLWDVTTSTYKILGNTHYSGRDLDINVFAPGQAFFVKAASAGTVEFNKNMQVHQTGATFKAPAAIVSWPGMTLTATSAATTSSTVITFNGNMTNGLDPTYDAGLLRGTNGLSLYTRLVEDNGVDFAIQCLPENYNNLIIPVGIDCKAGGDITFSAENITLPSGCNAVLEDKTTGISTSLTGGAIYKATLPAETSGIGRFYIRTDDTNITGTSGLNAGISNLKAYSTNGVIIIKGEVSDKAIAALYTLQGIKVLVHPLQKGSLNILSCPELKNGIYLLTILQNGETLTRKLMLK